MNEKQKALLALCRVYKGEKKAPLFTDEFKAYVWSRERMIVLQGKDKEFNKKNGIKIDPIEEHFKTEIKAAIDLFAEVPFGGNPTGYYKRYFAF